MNIYDKDGNKLYLDSIGTNPPKTLNRKKLKTFVIDDEKINFEAKDSNVKYAYCVFDNKNFRVNMKRDYKRLGITNFKNLTEFKTGGKEMFFENKKTLYQKDGMGKGEIYERKNDFIQIQALRGMENYSNMSNYFTTIGLYHMPINVLPHVNKHFPGDSNSKKLALIEDIMDFKKKGYSYVIYSNTDKRFKLGKEKVKINQIYIQVLRENVLYEICVTTSIEMRKKTISDINQINSFYIVDPNWEERHDKLSFSTITESHFNSEEDKYHIFILTKDSKLQTEKPIGVFEKENNVIATEMMRAMDIKSVDMNLLKETKDNIEKELERSVEVLELEKQDINNTTTTKINTKVLKRYLKEMKDELTVEEFVSIYETDSLPTKTNLAFEVYRAMEEKFLNKTGILAMVLAKCINTKNNSVDISDYFTFDNISDFSDELHREVNFFNEGIGYKMLEVLEIEKGMIFKVK